jgi:hypothetical protein
MDGVERYSDYATYWKKRYLDSIPGSKKKCVSYQCYPDRTLGSPSLVFSSFILFWFLEALSARVHLVREVKAKVKIRLSPSQAVEAYRAVRC